MEKEVTIPKSVYPDIQKNIDNALKKEESKQEPLFCLEDLNNPKYAPKNLKENTLKKNKGPAR